MVAALVISLLWILTNIYIGVYSERKISAFMQDRLGPMEVGKFGIFQIIADLVKLIQKEDIVPTLSQSYLFKIAPWIIFLSVFVGFAVIPFSGDVIGSNNETGVFFLMTIISIDIFGILLAGWASNNKYSIFGAMRAVAQMISYEIPMGICVLCVCVFAGSLNLQTISFEQGIWATNNTYLLGISSFNFTTNAIGGFLSWNIFQYPILIPVYIIFLITALAECNRAPFDLPEAESELVGGFHTEYSGMRFAIVFLSEYGIMLLMNLLAAILFLGSWNTPLPNIGSIKLADWTTGSLGSFSATFWGILWLALKAYFGIFIQMWVRWTLPRLRIDQLLYLSWKVLLPFSIVLLLASSIWKYFLI